MKKKVTALAEYLICKFLSALAKKSQSKGPLLHTNVDDIWRELLG
jgi:hypothetical protein